MIFIVHLVQEFLVQLFYGFSPDNVDRSVHRSSKLLQSMLPNLKSVTLLHNLFYHEQTQLMGQQKSRRYLKKNVLSIIERMQMI